MARASAFQAEGCEFESHYPLQFQTFFIKRLRELAQLVAHTLWERGVVSSSLAFPTMNETPLDLITYLEFDIYYKPQIHKKSNANNKRKRPIIK